MVINISWPFAFTVPAHLVCMCFMLQLLCKNCSLLNCWFKSESVHINIYRLKLHLKMTQGRPRGKIKNLSLNMFSLPRYLMIRDILSLCRKYKSLHRCLYSEIAQPIQGLHYLKYCVLNIFSPVCKVWITAWYLPSTFQGFSTDLLTPI